MQKERVYKKYPKAFYYKRSSRPNYDPQEEPPSEKELFQLNPLRRNLILNNTKWDDVIEGTANFKVNNEFTEWISQQKPFFIHFTI